ncbi:MAG: TlpA family protein disulfide reductase, partial [Acidobacteriales bacterium]|nr:TlpA family protein disulfide reductase [Terriglobales bacterium]
APAVSPGVEALINKPAPEFELPSLDGKSVKLSDYKGKAVVLNFWATWCTPCKVEMPWLVDLEKKYQGQGVEIVGISMDDLSRDKVKSFTREMGLNYPVLMGKESAKNEEMLEEHYGGLEGLPTTFYIDRSGKIVETVEGLISKSEIESNIKKAMGNS